MQITLFTSNQPRHIYLAQRLSLKHKVFCVIEGSSIQSNRIKSDTFFSGIRQIYFKKVIEAEKKIFGEVNFLNSNIETLNLAMGDINFLNKNILDKALNSQLYLVFGSGYIKDWLCDFLIDQRAINLHMGISPYYRGSACNFWALYDNKPNFVGATIHFLDKNIDSGKIITSCAPKYENEDAFEFSMKAVKAGQEKLMELIDNESIFKLFTQIQNNSLEIRYSRKKDFSDKIISEYLGRNINSKKLKKLIETTEKPILHN